MMEKICLVSERLIFFSTIEVNNTLKHRTDLDLNSLSLNLSTEQI